MAIAAKQIVYKVFNNLFKKSIFQSINMSKFKIFSQLLQWKLLINEFCGTLCIHYTYNQVSILELIKNRYLKILSIEVESKQITWLIKSFDLNLFKQRPKLKKFVNLATPKKSNFFHYLFTLSNAKHGESIVIGLAPSSTSKGPQVKTAEPMDSIKVTNCSIQLGWILARYGFAKNYMGSRPEAKKCHFFI